MIIGTTKIFIDNLKAFRSQKRTAINEGGTSSSKTYSILQLLVFIAKNSRKRLVISVVSESLPHLKRGCIRDFKNILDLDYNDKCMNKTELFYRFPNGTIIEFFSADNSAKCRGSRRDILYINECNNVSKATFDELEVRTKMFVFLDFNPVAEFWAHDMQGYPEVEWIHSTYQDAKHVLPKVTVERIEARKDRDPNWWRVYGLGLVGNLEGLVHPNFKIIKVDQIPEKGRVFYGLDFGYTNDPTALVYNLQKGDKIFSRQLIYETGLKNNQIANRMKQLEIKKGWKNIWADSAEPKSIDEIYSYGFNIKGAIKGPDSLQAGIQFVNQFEQYWTEDSLDCIKEQRNYRYLQDKNGKWLNVPVDDWNHGMDARRYGIYSELFKPGIDYSKFAA